MRLILDGQSTRGDISDLDVEAHFDQLYQEKAYDETALYELPAAPDDCTLAEMIPFIGADIKTRHSAPQSREHFPRIRQANLQPLEGSRSRVQTLQFF